MNKDKENDSTFKKQISTKSRKQKHVLFTLHSKRHSCAQGTKQPDESVIPTVFDFTDDPDYGQIDKDLTDPDPKQKQLQSMRYMQSETRILSGFKS
eukprot:170349-Rhodomonas_salina.1